MAYTKEPPYLPPQLRHILLNADALPAAQGVPVLPEPLPVTLDHLYCTAIRDGVMVQGLTRRFRGKYTSTVFYTMMPVSPTLKVAEAAGWRSSPRRAAPGAMSTEAASVPSAAPAVPPGAPAGAPGVRAPESASSSSSLAPAGASPADEAAIRSAIASAEGSPEAAAAAARGLTAAQRDAMLARLRARLDGSTMEMHQAALRQYQQASRTLTRDESTRLYDAVKTEAHRRLHADDAEYRAVYTLLHLAHEQASGR